MKKALHPDYAHLASFVQTLPAIFNREGEVIYKGRNEIRVFDTEQGKVAVKSFRIPRFLNRIIYTFIRDSKAKRSYCHSLMLQANGIDVPAPIAYIEEKKCGLLSHSYYVSGYLAYSGIMYEAAYHTLDEISELAKALGRFTAELHDKNILHSDYSPGNILYRTTGSGYRFALLDTNRMLFKQTGGISWKAGCYNLRRLWGSNATIACIASEYAKIRGFEENKIIVETLRQHARFWKRYARRHVDSKPYRLCDTE
jgi:tRNA A-37 threonylcarbamoyl transferase component Bud32